MLLSESTHKYKNLSSRFDHSNPHVIQLALYIDFVYHRKHMHFRKHERKKQSCNKKNKKTN